MALCCSALTISDCEAAQRWGYYAPSAGRTSGASSALCHGCNREFPSGPVCPQCGNAVLQSRPSSARTGMDRPGTPNRGEDVEGPELSGNGHWGCPSYPTIPVMIAKRNAITSNHRKSPTTILRGERMRKFSVSRATLMMLPRNAVPCANDPRGTSFPTKIMERRYQQPETLFDPLIALLTSDIWRGFSRLPRSQFD
jgi:hypothetical protein